MCWFIYEKGLRRELFKYQSLRKILSISLVNLLPGFLRGYWKKQRCPVKKVFLKISGPASNIILKRDSGTDVFLGIFKSNLFEENLRPAVSGKKALSVIIASYN